MLLRKLALKINFSLQGPSNYLVQNNNIHNTKSVIISQQTANNVLIPSENKELTNMVTPPPTAPNTASQSA
jgi:hypothetical protein